MNLNITKGEIVKDWRGKPAVQRVCVKLDGWEVEKLVKNAIATKLKQMGVRIPDLNNQSESAAWLRTAVLGDYDGYDYPHLCHMELSYYEEIKDLKADD